MAWSAPIYVYLWLAGMAGGAYFAAFIADRFTGGGNRQLFRLATYLGIPMAVIGVILLIVDLGKPIRFWHLLTEFNVSSPMSMGTWILFAWVLIAVVLAVIWWSERFFDRGMPRSLQRLTSFLGGINVIFAVLLMTYTGVLLAVSNQSLWAGSVLLPCLFVASAISTGIAILIVGAMITNASTEVRLALNQCSRASDWTISNRTIVRLAEADAGVIVIELLALVSYAVWLANSSMAGASEGLSILLNGSLAAPFWIGVVLLALLIPLWLDIANWGKQIGSNKRVAMVIASSSLCVVIGGLILRAVITIGGQS
jgi:polysulfide reductase chain C